MALYWPTLQFYACVYVAFVCRYVAPSGECYYNTVYYVAMRFHFHRRVWYRTLSLRYACI